MSNRPSESGRGAEPKRAQGSDHGDNGAGLGASHQTGSTGVIARLLDLFGRLSGADVMTVEKGQLADRLAQEQAYGREAVADRA
jgi:hypothetical protein